MIFNLGGKGSSGGPGEGAGQAGAADVIKDTDTQNFEQDVLLASMEVPVIVDFWAPWCGPCKQLTPALEKVVKAAAGKVRLVKINIDENQALAGQMGVKSIPTVAAFKQGQLLDGFMGALPESQLKQFIERLVGGALGPSPAEQLLEMGEQAFAAGDFANAAKAFATILKEEPQNATALGKLAHCYLSIGEPERARQTLELVAPADKENAAVKAAYAELALSETSVDTAEIKALRLAVDGDPDNLQARYDLATALASNKQRAEAIDELLVIVKADREWQEEAARKQLLSVFDALGQTHELTVQGRRRLSSILFS